MSSASAAKATSAAAAAASSAVRRVARVHSAHKQREGGGFIVRRPVGGAVSQVDPFLMLDHFGPVDYAPGEAVGAPDHPHRGFETVTYILDGEWQHKDSHGNEGNLGPGWVQWMTAGAGVIHSEMPSKKMIKEGGRMEGFQLWVNLPSHLKMTTPRYQDTPPDRIPEATTEDGAATVRVIAGRALGKEATIDTHTKITFLDARLRAGASLDLPVEAVEQGFVYVYRGAGAVGPADDRASVREGQMALLGDGDSVGLHAAADSEMRALVLLGEPIGEPVARHGPFVMNTRDEIHQAVRDFHAGRLGRIQGAEERLLATRRARESQKKSGRWREV